MDSITIPYIVKGIIKNYRLDSIEKVLQLLKALYSAGVTIEVNEARGKFKVMITDGFVWQESEEFDISLLKDLVDKIKQLGYIHVATDLYHSYEPLQRMVFTKTLFANREKLKEIFMVEE